MLLALVDRMICGSVKLEDDCFLSLENPA